jgi:hypothetical protein
MNIHLHADLERAMAYSDEYDYFGMSHFIEEF